MSLFAATLALGVFAASADVQQQDAQPRRVAPADVQAVTPGLAGHTDDVLFGDLWRRDLAPRDRSLVTITTLMARRPGRAAAVSHQPGDG
jgi:4-carboxymuconolactone decarboxylase